MSNDVKARMKSASRPCPLLFPLLTVKQPSPFLYMVFHLVLISGFPVNVVGFGLRFLILIHSSFPVKSFHPFHSLRHTSRMRSMRKHMTFASDPNAPV